MSKNYALFSSDDSRWATPPEVFEPLHREFHFGLDVCALMWSKKSPAYIGPDHPLPQQRNAFNADWHHLMHTHNLGSTAWCNPPYGRGLEQWMALCAQWSSKLPVVALIPARTDTIWWHDVVMPTAYEIRAVRGRIHFLDPETEGAQRRAPSPMPLALVVWHPTHTALLKQAGEQGWSLPPVRYTTFEQEQRR